MDINYSITLSTEIYSYVDSGSARLSAIKITGSKFVNPADAHSGQRAALTVKTNKFTRKLVKYSHSVLHYKAAGKKYSITEFFRKLGRASTPVFLLNDGESYSADYSTGYRASYDEGAKYKVYFIHYLPLELDADLPYNFEADLTLSIRLSNLVCETFIETKKIEDVQIIPIFRFLNPKQYTELDLFKLW